MRAAALFAVALALTAPAQNRGRGAIQIITLTSSGWPDGGQIPAKHAQPGRDVSPPLAWSNAPETTVSYVLIETQSVQQTQVQVI